jgi:hypothetical protein
MIDSVIFLSIALAILMTWLALSVGHRLRTKAAEIRAHEKQYPGRAFDTSAIGPGLRRVREDHAAAVRNRPRDDFYRAELLAKARRMVADLSYFQHTHREHEFQKHDA